MIGKSFFMVMVMLFNMANTNNIRTGPNDQLYWLSFDRNDTMYTLYFYDNVVEQIDTTILNKK